MVKGVTELESAIVALTPFRVLPVHRLGVAGHRRKVMESFSAIEAVERRGRPMFVLAHMLVPHPPFVFNGDGSLRLESRPFRFLDGSHFGGSRDEYRDGYRNQVMYVMSRVLRLIRALKEKGKEQWIILQGDHGSGLNLDQDEPARTDARERLAILLAIHAPGGEFTLARDTTPVNVFRIVFNTSFGTSFPLLRNMSFLSPINRPYELVIAAER